MSFLGFKVPEVFNLASFLTDRHLEEGRGDKVALYYLDERVTYKELCENVNRFGNALRRLGITPEERVLILLWDSPALFYAYLGAMKVGAVPILVNTLSSPKDILFFLKDSRARVLVAGSDLYEKVEPIRKEVPYLKHVVLVGNGVREGLDFWDLLEAEPSQLEPEETSRDDMAFWMYTSGTTGLPKGVVHLHHDLLYFWPPVCETALEVKEDDVVFCTSKTFFSYGRNATVETTLLYGLSVILWPHWPRPEEIADVVKRYRPTLFFSVPSFYSALLREMEKGLVVDFSSIRAFVTAGEAMPPAIVEKLSRLFNKRIVNGVGSTDVGGMYIATRDLREKPESSGRLLPGFEARLVDEEGREVKKPFEIGELWLRNDGITPFYWRRHERNKEVFYGEWFKTGDLFYVDEEGFFYYQGRADDMLKVSGQWLAPMEVENVLLEHPAVAECAVVGVPFEDGLIKAKGFVVLKEGHEPSEELERELIEFVKGKLAPFKAPKAIAFVNELPRTATGKIMRYRLKTLT